MKQIDELLQERPAFHSNETEIARSFELSESFLIREKAELIARQRSVCYGIGSDLAHFLEDSVGPSSQTLETGAGISTLVFALRRTTHIAVTPNRTEVEAIQCYARTKGIDLSQVEFVIEASELYLPQCQVQGLDLVLIDGKHAFPWPVLDWFFTAEHLRRGGLLVLDDSELKSVGILVEFMTKDPRWSLVRSFGTKTVAFRKESDSVHDVAWHMQPYNFGERSSETNQLSFFRRLVSMLMKR